MRLIATPLLLAALLLPACASLQDTPAQARTHAAWRTCEASFPTVRLVRVNVDGSSAFEAMSPGALAAAQACMAQAGYGRTP